METALREQLSNGTYRPGGLLRPQRELADEFGVSRDTVQRVLRLLAQEGWIESRQGSGNRVLKVPRVGPGERRPARRGRASLGPLLDEAFEQPEVYLDVFSLTSETFYSHLRVQTERINAREITPGKLRVRLMLPSEEPGPAYPRAKDPSDRQIWERWRRMARDHCNRSRALIKELQVDSAVDAALEIRRVPLTPEFKLYVLNNCEMLHGPYEVVERTITLDDDAATEVDALDVLGLGSTLTYHRREDDDESHDSEFFASHQGWFESCWKHLGVVQEGT
ncbi:winged helix-turn-helix domain-containing protein [Streptomyces sp. NPDC093544]|uniref:winged helix-turn-helix domain-containing protein n=1 Tax=Streptomyces sp. NPDC093544 TaxID=3155200 RepID=UPI00341F0765